MICHWAQSSGTNAIRALSPAGWYRLGQGITVTGSGVSSWSDQSGNGRDLLQGTDAKRPALQTGGSILFDGTAHALQAALFTMSQPFTWYLLFKQITWTNNDHIANGRAANTALFQNATTPRIRLFAGSTTTENPGLAVDTYAVLSAVFNGASSLTQINNAAPVTGDAGANNAGGFTLGADNGAAAGFSNIQVKEVILFTAAHDATQRASVISYLTAVGGL